MALTKNQKQVVREMMLAIAEERIRVEKEIEGHVICSIALRKVSSQLEDAYQKGSSLLKPRDVTKKLKNVEIRMGVEAEK